jgi:hypothetical protein
VARQRIADAANAAAAQEHKDPAKLLLFIAIFSSIDSNAFQLNIGRCRRAGEQRLSLAR